MPKTMHGKPVNERAWKRAKAIVKEKKPELSGDAFWAMVTTIYKSVCKSPDYACEGRGVYSPGMSDVLSRLGALIDGGSQQDQLEDDDAWLDELSEDASFGKELLFNYISQKDLYGLRRALPKEAQADLRKIMEGLITALTPRNARTGQALRRLANMVSRGPNPKTAGDELYKIADEIGVSLRR